MDAFFATLIAEEVLEPMVEPIDEPDCSPFDYAEVTGLWDEMYPEPMTSCYLMPERAMTSRRWRFLSISS
jgi:hypothetical protein